MFLVASSVVLGFINIFIEGKIIDDAINTGIKTGSLNILIKLIVLYFIIIIISRVFSYISEILFTQTTQKILIKLRMELFRHILRLNLSFFQKTSTGEILSRLIPEVQSLGVLLSRIILVPLSCIITIIAGFGLVARIDVRLGLLAIGIYSIVFLFLPKLRAKLKVLSRKSTEQMRRITQRTEESISHYSEIQANNTFPYEEYLFKNSLLGFFGISMNVAKLYGATTFFSGFFSELATLSIYGAGAYLVIKTNNSIHPLTVGAIFVMIRALSTVISPINALIDFSQRYQEAVIKFDMITDYLNIPVFMDDKKSSKPLNEINGKVDANSLSFGFNPAEKIIKNINLNIKPGEHIALVGPAGCGKSTLALIINRMLQATEGSLIIDDNDLLEIKLDTVRKKIGYVSQAKTSSPILFAGNIAENIIYGLKRKNETETVTSPSQFLDIESAKGLYEDVVKVIKDVDLYKDVLNFGLCNVSLNNALKQKDSIFAITNPEEIRKEILKGRTRFREKIGSLDSELIEFFDEEKYMDHLSIMENIIFSSAETYIHDAKLYNRLRKYLDTICSNAGLLEAIYTVGSKTAVEFSGLLKMMTVEEPAILQSIRLPDNIRKEEIMSIGEKIRIHGSSPKKSPLSDEEKNAVIELGYYYVYATGIDIYIDDSFKNNVIKAREIFRKTLPADLKQDVIFYEKERYIDSVSIRENLLMGKVNTLLFQAETKISSILNEVIQEVDLEDEIINMGLLMDIGERGIRLSGGQAQKVAIARVLIKKPEILILDEATSALDNASQQKINKILIEQFKNKTVITIAHRLDTIKNYDRIAVLKSGEIFEIGSFQELMDKKCLFYELWVTSYGTGV